MSKPLNDLAVYIPMDRRLALAQGKGLPERVQGAALFADIDGFTMLTDQLLQELGPQRGAEELTLHLNRVYDAVIDVLHTYRASVIAFAGDAVTSWIDGDDGLRAIACALAMREAMSAFRAVETPNGSTITLTIKVVISVGSARRYQVGDPDIRLLDALAGETLIRLAQTEELVEAGEIMLDSQSLAAIVHDVHLEEHRSDISTGIAGGIIRGLVKPVHADPWPAIPDGGLVDERVRPWVHRPVYTRMQRSLGNFLAELRPTVALFLRFGGIDYDGDPMAGKKLDNYICWVQQIAERYEGTVIDLNIGDKGSYLYINYGALVAHEDSSARAVSSALALHSPPADFDYIGSVQIGISRGRMRVGAYGGRAHRTYGALGAEVNMAARLMMAAKPSETLVSQHAAWAAGHNFEYEDIRPLRVKGRKNRLHVYRLVAARSLQPMRLDVTMDDGPLVGRKNELSQMAAWLEEAQRGRGRIVAIRGDAGLGKSRFATESLREAERVGFDLYGGACESYGVLSNYLVWQPIWRGLLDVDAGLTTEHQTRLVTDRLVEVDADFQFRAPLLGMLLNLPFADSELTAAMDAKTRKTALESLLIDYLRVICRNRPSVLLLEDCHWLDPLSQDLLDALALAVADMPLLVLLTFRDPELERLDRSLSERQENYVELVLPLLNREESVQHIQLMVERLYGEFRGNTDDAYVGLSEEWVARIAERAEGNPFYIVELLTEFRERGIWPDASASVAELDLPDSLHNLALSRVDRLDEHPASVLKIASVIGRHFYADWPHQVEPALGQLSGVLDSLHILSERSMVVLDDLIEERGGEENNGAAAVPAYSFRQTIVQDALYNSIPHQVREVTHAAIGGHIETAYFERQEQMLDLLAYHYERSQVQSKRIEYLRRAGEAAQAAFANEAAIDYYRRLLPLLSPSETIDVFINLGDVLQLVGQWDEAAESYQAALTAANDVGDVVSAIRAHRAMGRLLYHERPQDALRWLNDGLALSQANNPSEVDISAAAFRVDIGWAHMQLGDLDSAMDALMAGLDGLPKEPSTIRGDALSSLTGTHIRGGDVESALHFGEEALRNARSIPDLWQEQIALSNLAVAHYMALDWRDAAASLQEAAILAEKIGDKRVLAGQAANMGITYMNLGDKEIAEHHLHKGIELARECHLVEYEFLTLQSLAELKIRAGELESAEALLNDIPRLLDATGSQDNEIKVQRAWAELKLSSGAVDEAQAYAEEAIKSAEKSNQPGMAAIGQRVLGEILIQKQQPARAEKVLAASFETLHPSYLHEAARSQFYLGRAKVAQGEVSAGLLLVAQAHSTFERLGAGFDLTDIRHYLQAQNRSSDEE